MTQQQPQQQEENSHRSKVMLVIVTLLWLLFLAGILGYNPYMQNKVPKKVEEKTELIKETYKEKSENIKNEGEK